VIRGEDLTRDESVDAGVLDLPLLLAPWERGYTVAEYRSAKASFPTPSRPPLEHADLPAAGSVVSDETVTEALVALAAPWSEQSNGTVAVVAVEGTAESAIAALPSLFLKVRPPGPR
jgi:hypothetical protein